MVTHKQFPNHKVYEMEIGGRPFTVETGKVAELANAECICRYGDTVVLTTCTANPIPKAGIDYFPLTIEFEERMYSVGRIPGSFNRREGKPSERGILNSRIIDRPMRPLFTAGFCAETQVIATVLSADQQNDPDVLALTGASCALSLSDIPFDGPVAGGRVAYIDGQFVLNPTAKELAGSAMDMIVACTRKAVVMVEGRTDELSEDIVLSAISYAFEQ